MAEDENELIKGDQFPSGFAVAVSSLSRDKRYGELVLADWNHYQEDVAQNKLVEVKTGRVLCVMRAGTGILEMITAAFCRRDDRRMDRFCFGKWMANGARARSSYSRLARTR